MIGWIFAAFLAGLFAGLIAGAVLVFRFRALPALAAAMQPPPPPANTVIVNNPPSEPESIAKQMINDEVRATMIEDFTTNLRVSRANAALAVDEIMGSIERIGAETNW